MTTEVETMVAESVERAWRKGEFEVSLIYPPIKGKIAAYAHEHGGVQPKSIIRTDEEWAVAIRWQLEGPLVQFISGKWHIHLYLESIGPGAELRLPIKEIEMKVDRKDGKYSYEVVVPPNMVPVDHDSTPFKLVTVVTYITPYGDPGPMAGFVDGQVLQFYKVEVN
jgi:hypothetical protein